MLCPSCSTDITQAIGLAGEDEQPSTPEATRPCSATSRSTATPGSVTERPSPTTASTDRLLVLGSPTSQYQLARTIWKQRISGSVEPSSSLRIEFG